MLAHNLIRWTETIGETHVRPQRIVARTTRLTLLAIAGRLVNRSGTLTLRAPLNWPWATLFSQRLAALRALPPSG